MLDKYLFNNVGHAECTHVCGISAGFPLHNVHGFLLYPDSVGVLRGGHGVLQLAGTAQHLPGAALLQRSCGHIRKLDAVDTVPGVERYTKRLMGTFTWNKCRHP